MKVSKKVRGDLLAAIVSMKSTRSNIHGKVNDAMTTAAKEATGHRVRNVRITGFSPQYLLLGVWI